MPDFPITDAHVHFWDPQRLRYAWLDEEPLLNRPFLPADYRRAAGSIAVDGLVFVQADAAASQGIEEVRWVEELAANDPIIRGIVAFAPLEQGREAARHLDALKDHSMVRGVRRLLQAEPDPAFCLRPGFMEGVRLLAAYGYTFDVCIYHHQLPAVIELVRRTPEVRFVLDHIGKPAIRDGLLDPWRDHIRTLAGLPNVVCKLSGVVTEADHQRWTEDGIRPYIEHALECFGIDRVMFGSDWPVQTLASDYPRWVAVLDDILAGESRENREKVYRENVRAFYGLDG